MTKKPIYALQAINPLLWRAIAFLCIFVAISGIAGPRIIASSIFFRDGFGAYGGIGKAAIFGLIAFVLLARHQRRHVQLTNWHVSLLWWFGAALGAFAVSWMSVSELLAGQHAFLLLLGAHAGLVLSVAFAAIGCFGVKNLQLLWRTYRHECMLAAGIGVAFYVFLFAVYALWRPLAGGVMYSVHWLLGAGGLHALVVPPNTLILDKFGITVAEYCSGIESIALFTGLYVIVGLLDWPRLRKKRFFLIFPVALLVLFGLNIMRVYGLIVAGYFINQEIAFSLFHTYAGLIFFVVYSACFWTIAYKHIIIARSVPAPGDTA